MALTEGHDVHAALHEAGMNKLISAIYATRRYYFHHAAPPLGAGTPGVDFGVLPPLRIPGAEFALAYSIDLSKPVIDFAPQDPTLTLPPPLTLGPNQFSISMTASVCVLCGLRLPVAPAQPGLVGLLPTGAPVGVAPPPAGAAGQAELLCATLGVWAVGHPTVTPLGPQERLIGLAVDDIAVRDIGQLQPIAECLAEEMVNALLASVRITVSRIAFGAFPVGLVLEDGPRIADDQIKVWAGIV